MKHTVGRNFKGDMTKRRGNFLSISFKMEDHQVLDQLRKFLENDALPISETVVDAIRLKFGVKDLMLVRSVILEKYADKKLVGPRLFKTFDDIFEWELQNNPDLRDLAIKWNIARQTMGCLAYLYFAKPTVQ